MSWWVEGIWFILISSMNSFPNLYIHYCTLPPWGPDNRVNIINRIYTSLESQIAEFNTVFIMIALLSIPPAAWLFAKCLFTTLITRLGCVWWAAVHLLLRWVYLNVSPVFFSTLFSTLTTQGLLTPYSLRQHFCVQMGIPVS